MFECLAFEELHDHEGPAIFLADVVNGADVGMVQRGCCLCFSAETAERLRIASYIFGQKLEGYEAVQAGVLGLVDHPHTSATEFFDDAVVRDSLPD